MTVQERIARFNQLRSALPQRMADLAEDYGNTYVALVKEESIEKGINKDGQPGNKVNYSSKPVKSSSLIDVALNQAGRNYLKNKPTATYYGLRQAQGMRSASVNLQYSGLSWKGYKLLSVSVSGGKVSIIIGATGEHAHVFVANIKRYGAFYKATPEQRQQLREDVQAEVRKWLTNGAA